MSKQELKKLHKQLFKILIDLDKMQKRVYDLCNEIEKKYNEIED